MTHAVLFQASLSWSSAGTAVACPKSAETAHGDSDVKPSPKRCACVGGGGEGGGATPPRASRQKRLLRTRQRGGAGFWSLAREEAGKRAPPSSEAVYPGNGLPAHTRRVVCPGRAHGHPHGSRPVPLYEPRLRLHSIIHALQPARPRPSIRSVLRGRRALPRPLHGRPPPLPLPRQDLPWLGAVSAQEPRRAFLLLPPPGCLRSAWFRPAEPPHKPLSLRPAQGGTRGVGGSGRRTLQRTCKAWGGESHCRQRPPTLAPHPAGGGRKARGARPHRFGAVVAGKPPPPRASGQQRQGHARLQGEGAGWVAEGGRFQEQARPAGLPAPPGTPDAPARPHRPLHPHHSSPHPTPASLPPPLCCWGGSPLHSDTLPDPAKNQDPGTGTQRRAPPPPVQSEAYATFHARATRRRP